MRQEIENQLAEDMGRFFGYPLDFVMYAFPWRTDVSIQQVEMPPEYQERYGCKYGPDLWAIEFLEDLGREVRARNFDGKNAVDPIRFATASGHGIGKSTLCAWLVLWIMSCIPFSKGTLTASTSDQLQGKTWAEVGKWYNRCITQHWFRYSSARGNMAIRALQDPENWYFKGSTCKEENAEAFQGQHAANASSVFLFDEASGVPDKIFEVREGGLTDGMPMIFDFGNPTRNTGWFFENCVGKYSHRYIVRSIDSRSVSITNKKFFNDLIEDNGLESDIVKVRVLGQFPSIGVSQFISSDAVIECMKREAYDDYYASLVIGVDVARFGDDESCIYPRIGRDAKSFPPKVFHGKDTVQVAGLVIETINEFKQIGKDCKALFIDGGGIGAGVIDHLKYLGYEPIEALAQHKPRDFKNYRYRIDEMWGKMRDDINKGLALPARRSDLGTKLFNELTQREYSFTLKGQMTLESKKDMKVRGVNSPNVADGLALTYYEDVAMEKSSLSHSQTPRYTIHEYDPLEERRIIKRDNINPDHRDILRQLGVLI